MKSHVYETGISEKEKPLLKVNQKLLLYRCYKKYDHNSFSKVLQNKISQPYLSFKQFLEIFQPMLDAFAL